MEERTFWGAITEKNELLGLSDLWELWSTRENLSGAKVSESLTGNSFFYKNLKGILYT